ncbi:hypothetical protein Q4512_12465 [Oceanihabitans sp. 2_MG-2023]|uniref:hypothetical protein n=1 Tax=Oceanihabitans sp. 2_MG-2023 TaxID=3062661 RepID=UPI0026E41392|nr:hypothetical protein [Oceanihabitans sp. 2_MG-2023]MDO6597733.1 hypothetical protein [Oceanihabitans sp. 2_MG-2023]
MRKLKLIWDFRGPSAEKTAQHHEIHLKEYVKNQSVNVDLTGHEIINNMHSIAFMIINEEDKKTFRDTLKPHRGEWVD